MRKIFLVFVILQLSVFARADDDLKSAVEKKEWISVQQILKQKPSSGLRKAVEPFLTDPSLIQAFISGKLPQLNPFYDNAIGYQTLNGQASHVTECLGSPVVGKILSHTVDEVTNVYGLKRGLWVEIESDGKLLNYNKGLKLKLLFGPAKTEKGLVISPPPVGSSVILGLIGTSIYLDSVCVQSPSEKALQKAKDWTVKEWGSNAACKNVDVKTLNETWSLNLKNNLSDEEVIRLFSLEQKVFDLYKKRGSCGDADDYRIYLQTQIPDLARATSLPFNRFEKRRPLGPSVVQFLKSTNLCQPPALLEYNKLMGKPGPLTSFEQENVLKLENELAYTTSVFALGNLCRRDGKFQDSCRVCSTD